MFAAVVIAAGGIIAFRAFADHSLIVHPDDPCTERPPLVSWRGVTLQPVAMRSFKRAARETNHAIRVVQSYRSCHEQAVACRNICGDPNGCAGRCARPGSSYHQLGAAVDITQGSLDTAGVIETLSRNGWCQSQPNTDPGHFSFDGCH